MLVPSKPNFENSFRAMFKIEFKLIPDFSLGLPLFRLLLMLLLFFSFISLQINYYLVNFKNQKDDFDKAAEDLRLATRHLGMIVGKVNVEEILSSIFNDFCIGK